MSEITVGNVEFTVSPDVTTATLREAAAELQRVIDQRDGDRALDIVAATLRDLEAWIAAHRSAS